MITLDCSEHIDIHAAAFTQAQVDEAYAALPQEVRSLYEERYLHKELPVIGTLEAEELRRIVLVFWRAIDHARECYAYIESIKPYPVDFELSIDETRTITTPAEHFVVADSLYQAGVRPVSVAPHFSGEFEKASNMPGIFMILHGISIFIRKSQTISVTNFPYTPVPISSPYFLPWAG